VTVLQFSLARFWFHPVGKILTISTGLIVLVAVSTFLYFYSHYAAVVDEKLARGAYSNTSRLFAMPQTVSVGDQITTEELSNSLIAAGYSTSRENRVGRFQVTSDGIEVYPGVDSYFQPEAHAVTISKGKVQSIVSLRDNTERARFSLEPELITNLFDRNREKRRIVKFADIPEVVRNAVLSAEDKRFFQHIGLDPLRILKSAYIDLKTGTNAQGASTLSMQLARELLLSKERHWKRKIPETFITLHLERMLTKEEIFEHYCNQIDIGRVGSFSIHGFGEGAQAFFGKDLRKLSLTEAALLAGLPQGPSVFNPFRNPERAKKRRNIILLMMRDNGFITQADYEQAIDAPLGVKVGYSGSEDAPYFVDLVNDYLQSNLGEHDFQASNYRIYTTLDVNLQRAAGEAMAIGLKEVDQILTKRGRTPAKGWPQVQAALVAIDPENGEIRALVGGRDYTASQLNRALAKRQPGSIFKPFVYAAALATGLDGGPDSITPATTIVDEPTTFWHAGKPYEPGNFHDAFNGTVTVRQALMKSLNIPTVKMAEQIGYAQAAAVAKRAGLPAIGATPAMALGSYVATPIDMAGAYTVFANRGVYLQPSWIKMVRDDEGRAIYTSKLVKKEALDYRVAYMMTNLMEDVVRAGTGAGVRSRGFTLPVAGKTGSSHDGWFAGYTSKLICVVWVGYDDNRDIVLEGARSALPIWAEFMKRAHQYRSYKHAAPFAAPEGIVNVDVDSTTGKLFSSACTGTHRPEVFLAGTQPLETCGGGGLTQVASWDPDPPATVDEGAAQSDGRKVSSRRVDSIPVKPLEGPNGRPKPAEPKRGFFGRILEVFK
jgi:penicillin-binding protein 1B